MVLDINIMDNEAVASFMENQTSNKKIVLDPLLNAIASLPELKHCRLQHDLAGNMIQAPSDSSLRSLCQSPRQSLIFNSCGLSDDQCFVLADELKSKNLPLSILVVTRNKHISPLGWDAFVKMMAVNYNVVDFHHGEDGQVNAPSSEQLDKIAYYLRLNLAGRKHLLRGPMRDRREAWLDFLIRGRNDMDLLFYALQSDPSLYVTPNLIY
jgi:hypothetical protein